MPSTLWTHCIIEHLKAYDIRFLSYVPDSIIEQILKLARQDTFFDLLPLAREEEGIGVATGQYVGGHRSAVMLPTSGVGNAINALASLALPYQIPMPMFIGCRGELGEFNPSQVPMGQALRPILDSLRIPRFELTHPEEVNTIVDGALKLAFALESPVAILLSTQLAGWKDEK
ncbi:MAG: decarboxylase [Candidatus Tectomicrobia bacterium]|uniref:Decarboxylase n=1 Tax=Tectimicrobiota bacterium TaxID=2528274 RepID=A0A937VZ41_UNCTE|nr:decarboxylase [Candidatus Tectomicrobia bacterium]